MKSVTVHAALLAIALLAAFATWTAGDRPETERTLVEVWDRNPADLTAVTFRTDGRTVIIDRRQREGAGEGTYLWAVETIQDPAPPTPQPGDSAAADSGATPPAPRPPRVDEYPVGEDGPTLFEGFAQLRAIRALGEVDAEKRAAYGFDQSVDTVTLGFRQGEVRLTVGSEIVGGGDRYALNEADRHVYVLPAELFRALDYAGTHRLTRIQGFAPDDVDRVAVQAGARQRVMRRQPTTTPPYATWSDPTDGRADQTFSNFMSQIDRLWVARYRPDLDAAKLRPILRLDYIDARGDTLDTFELFSAGSADSTAYFLRTRATVVPGEIVSPVAERIEQDLETILPAGDRSAD